MTPRASMKLTTTRALTTWWGVMGAKFASTVVPVRQINEAMHAMKRIMDLNTLLGK
jgi:hypothetical protein